MPARPRRGRPPRRLAAHALRHACRRGAVAPGGDARGAGAAARAASLRPPNGRVPTSEASGAAAAGGGGAMIAPPLPPCAPRVLTAPSGGAGTPIPARAAFVKAWRGARACQLPGGAPLRLFSPFAGRRGAAGAV